MIGPLPKVIRQPALPGGPTFLRQLSCDRMAIMNAPPIKVCLKSVGLWTLFVSVVVLLTVVFSFLGTISCAVIAGMAMAASRIWNGRVIASSLVFPAVVLTLAHFSKIDLVSNGRLTVATVSFGAFWGTFLLTFLVMLLERRDGGRPAMKTADPSASTRRQVDGESGSGQREVAAGIVTAANPAGRPAELSLQALQGRWSCEVGATNGPSSRKIIEIAGDRFVLSVGNSDGSAQVCGEGVVKLEVSGPLHTLHLAGRSPGSGRTPAEG